MVCFVVLQLSFRTSGRSLLHSIVSGSTAIDLVATVALCAGLLLGKLCLNQRRDGEDQHDRERYEF
jgi:hypothetical protein